jgi:hypothetical protein
MFKKLLATSTALAAVFFLSACTPDDNGVNPSIDGMDGPHVNVANGFVTTSMIFKNIDIDGGADIPIPHFPGSSLYVGPNFDTGGMLLRLNVSVKEFWDNQDLNLNPHTLPGGRALPTVANGALPAVAMLVPQLNNTVLYLGLDVVGFFTPFNLDTSGVIVSMNFRNTENVKVGTISLVGADPEGKNSGVLLLLSTKLLGIGGSKAEYEAIQAAALQ